MRGDERSVARGVASVFDSIFKQHVRMGLAPFAPKEDVRLRSRAIARGGLLVSRPFKNEGHGAPKGAVGIVSLPASLATR